MLGATDYIIIGAYFLLTVSLGLYFARKWKGSEDFFLAGRSLTWPLIVGTSKAIFSVPRNGLG